MDAGIYVIKLNESIGNGCSIIALPVITDLKVDMNGITEFWDWPGAAGAEVRVSIFTYLKFTFKNKKVYRTKFGDK